MAPTPAPDPSVARIRLLILSTLVVISLLALLATIPTASSDGYCRDHYPYKVVDGHGHDGDGDGVGCEANPLWPDSSSDSGSDYVSTGYDRDEWGYQSGSARARLGCDSSEHVDHVVALKEAYDSGGSGWTLARKQEFANDPLNQWCLDGGVNMSKSDHDLAEWGGGSCAQRKFIAQRTVEIKSKYGIATDPAEQRANQAAMSAVCAGEPIVVSTPEPDAETQRESTQIVVRDAVEPPVTEEPPMTAASLWQSFANTLVIALWIWDGQMWRPYAERNGRPLPGAADFVLGADFELLPVFK